MTEYTQDPLFDVPAERPDPVEVGALAFQSLGPSEGERSATTMVDVERGWRLAVDTLSQLRAPSAEHWPARTVLRVRHYYEADCGMLATLLGRHVSDICREVEGRLAS